MAFSRMGRWLGRRLSIELSTGLTILTLTWLASANPGYAACEFFSAPQRFNTQSSGDVIVIGDQSGQPYRVVVLAEDQTTLAGIRACVLDAFATRSRFGPYIQVGSFSRRSDAEVIRRILRGSGYPARVTYHR